MAGIGDQLRAGREAGGLTIAEIARETGVPPHFLEALEREQFYELPDPVYVRGFIRTYSRFVGIEAATLIEQLPDELRFPGSAGAVIRMPPPEPKHAHQAPATAQPSGRASALPKAAPEPVHAAVATVQPRQVPERETRVATAPAPPPAPAPVQVTPPEATSPAAPELPDPAPAPPVREAVTPPAPAAARPPVQTVTEPPRVTPAPQVRVAPLTPAAATAVASTATQTPPAPAPGERIIGAEPEIGVIVDGGLLEAVPDPRARRRFSLPRMSLPLAGGAVALVLASVWLFSVIRGGGDGSLPADSDGADPDATRGSAVEVSAHNATRTATNADATATRTATRTPTSTSTPTSTPTPSPTPEPTATPVPPTATPTVYVPPPPPGVPVNAFALCRNLGGDNYDCGPDPVRVICAPGGGRFYDPFYTVLSPLPAEWVGWYERSVSGRLEGIQSAC